LHHFEDIIDYFTFTKFKKVMLSHGLWFKPFCQRWRTSQGHRQSRTLEKW